MEVVQAIQSVLTVSYNVIEKMKHNNVYTNKVDDKTTITICLYRN